MNCLGEAHNAGEEDNLDIDDPAVTNRLFYRYISQAYKLFLAGNSSYLYAILQTDLLIMIGEDAQYSVLEQQFVNTFSNNNVLLQDKISFIENANRQLLNEIEGMGDSIHRSCSH